MCGGGEEVGRRGRPARQRTVLSAEAPSLPFVSTTLVPASDFTASPRAYPPLPLLLPLSLQHLSVWQVEQLEICDWAALRRERHAAAERRGGRDSHSPTMQRKSEPDAGPVLISFKCRASTALDSSERFTPLHTPLHLRSPHSDVQPHPSHPFLICRHSSRLGQVDRRCSNHLCCPPSPCS